MKRLSCRLAGGLLALGLTSCLFAQEGHPLKGSWIGEWKSNQMHDEFVLLVLDWNGEEVSGVINPGTDNIEIKQASLDPENWTVTIEADTEVDGETVSYNIEGQIQNLELPSRSIVGSWRHQEGSGDFEIVRQ